MDGIRFESQIPSASAQKRARDERRERRGSDSSMLRSVSLTTDGTEIEQGPQALTLLEKGSYEIGSLTMKTGEQGDFEDIEFQEASSAMMHKCKTLVQQPRKLVTGYFQKTKDKLLGIHAFLENATSAGIIHFKPSGGSLHQVESDFCQRTRDDSRFLLALSLGVPCTGQILNSLDNIKSAFRD